MLRQVWKVVRLVLPRNLVAWAVVLCLLLLGCLLFKIVFLRSGLRVGPWDVVLTGPPPLLENHAPIGAIVAYGGSESLLPVEWMLCDGRPVPPGAAYNAIRALLGEGVWAKGDAVHLPDLRGRFLRGVDDPDGRGRGLPAAGEDPNSNERVHPLTGEVIGGCVGSVQGHATALPMKDFRISSEPDHRHVLPKHVTQKPGANDTFMPFEGGGNGSDRGDLPTTSRGAGKHTHVIDGGDRETRPTNMYINWIIKVR